MLLEPIDDASLQMATGLHVDTVRRLVSDKLLSPIETPRGRGMRRQWSIGDFRRAALVAAFMRAGMSAAWATPIVNECVDAMLTKMANEAYGPSLLVVYHRLYAFIEWPDADASEAAPLREEHGWRNGRLLVAVYAGDPPAWHGFDNTVFGQSEWLERMLSADQAKDLRSNRRQRANFALRAHDLAQNYEAAVFVHASRAIQTAERLAADHQRNMGAS